MTYDALCQVVIAANTRWSHRPDCPLDARDREDRIAQAIGDPGSVLARIGRNGDAPLESVVRWGTRAVIAVVDAETTLRRGMTYLNDAPGCGDRTPAGDLRCQTRAIDVEGVTYRCALRASHPDRRCDFEAEPAPQPTDVEVGRR